MKRIAEQTPNLIRGFTLIELLVAMALFVVLAAAMYTGTQWVMEERSIVGERAGKLENLQRTVRFLHNDFGQAYPRSVRDELGRGQVPALVSGRGAELSITLTRSGWRNPGGTNRSHLQRVQYRYNDEDQLLYRETWPVLDRVLGAEPRARLLLEELSEFEVEFLDANGNWVLDWPAADATGFTGMPRAIRYRLDTIDFGRIERIVEIPG